MVFISVSDRHLVIGSSDRLLVVDRSADGASFSAVRFQSIPEVSSDLKNKKYDENNRLRDDSPICGSFSPCGQLFAAADASKRLLVWRIISHSGSSSSNASHVSWQLHREFRLEKRPVAIRFVSAQNDVLVGDKSCDVYVFSLNSESLTVGRLLLGHVSLLLDIQLSADQHYLATCDRDEKIRISQYPLAHQIQSYCLGHREFVTSCAFIDSDRLVSSSGDGSVACWHFRTGRLAFQRQVTDDLSSRSGDSSPTNSRMVVNRIYRLNDALVIACVSAPAQMLLYLLTDNAFEFKHQLAFDSDIIDSTQHGSQVYVITRRSGIHLVEAHNFELQLRFISINLNEHEAGTAIVEKLAAIDVQSNFDQFFKVPFEANIEQYYENKKKRIKAKEGC